MFYSKLLTYSFISLHYVRIVTHQRNKF